MTDCIYFYLGGFFLLPVIIIIIFFLHCFLFIHACCYSLLLFLFYFSLAGVLYYFFYFRRISIFSEPFLPTLVTLLFFSFVINVRGYELLGRFTLLALLALSRSFPFNSYRVQKKQKNKTNLIILFFQILKKYIYI